MARSPLTLAAAATAAVSGVEVVDAAELTTNSTGRNASAVATLADGKRIVIRLPKDPDTDAELATEALALQALSSGVRALLDFDVPEFLGTAPLKPQRIFVTTFIPGYQVDANRIPAGRGVAASLGRAVAAIHALPASVVRTVGLPVRTADEVRSDARRIMDDAAATGRVPVRLMVRWREAIDDDALWRFEPSVTLGGAAANAFVYDERGDEPGVVGVIDWHGLSVGDPAVDLSFLDSAPDAVDSVHTAYAERSSRAPDEHLRTRARLHAELEFAKWLLHGRDTRDTAVMDDAASLLDQLADGVRDHDLHRATGGAGIDDAMAALQSVPSSAARDVDTSMQTDTYDPSDLAFDERDPDGSQDTEAIDPGLFAAEDEHAHRAHAAQSDTQAFDPLGEVGADDAPATTPEGERDIADAERAARAAIARWADDAS